MNLYLYIEITLYDKHDNLDFPTVNFAFIRGNILYITSPAYRVNISQLTITVVHIFFYTLTFLVE